jgi:hypothetical protein
MCVCGRFEVASPAATIIPRRSRHTRRETTADEERIPQRAVLIEQEDGLSRRGDPRPRARGLDLHQRHESLDLRLLRSEFGRDAAEMERLLAQRRSHPVGSAVAEWPSLKTK